MSMNDKMVGVMSQFDQHHESMSAKRYGAIYSWALALIGFIVLLAGAIMIPFPGPGWLLVFTGVGILAIRYNAARSLLFSGAKTYDSFYAWANDKGIVVKSLLFAITCIFTTGFFILSYYFFAPEFIANSLPFPTSS